VIVIFIPLISQATIGSTGLLVHNVAIPGRYAPAGGMFADRLVLAWMQAASIDSPKGLNFREAPAGRLHGWHAITKQGWGSGE
jgi:hypothetical protein